MIREYLWDLRKLFLTCELILQPWVRINHSFSRTYSRCWGIMGYALNINIYIYIYIYITLYSTIGLIMVDNMGVTLKRYEYSWNYGMHSWLNHVKPAIWIPWHRQGQSYAHLYVSHGHLRSDQFHYEAPPGLWSPATFRCSKKNTHSW